jgi:hypothetical protein
LALGRLRARHRWHRTPVERARRVEPERPFLLMLLIVPVFGIALLFFSALLKLRARKYSGTYFEMESVPFFLGQKLRGTVHAPLGDFKGPVRFRLNCIRRRKSPTHTHGVGVGGAKDTWDELVWCGSALDFIARRECGLQMDDDASRNCHTGGCSNNAVGAPNQRFLSESKTPQCKPFASADGIEPSTY